MTFTTQIWTVMVGLQLLVSGAAVAQTPRDIASATLTPVLSRAPWEGPGTGFLATALAEAQTALAQARLAAKAEDVETLRQHVREVLRAIGAESEKEKSDSSPVGGVRRAVESTLAQLTLAAADTQRDAQAFLPRAIAASRNVLGWCDDVAEVADRVGSASDIRGARADVARLVELARQLTSGRDVDGDGRVTFAPGEGGLMAVQITVGGLLGNRAAMARAPQAVTR